MQNLITRTITGVISIMLIMASLILHPAAFSFLILLVIIAGTLEFFRLIENENFNPQIILALINATAIFLIIFLVVFEYASPLFITLIPLLILSFFIAELFRNKPSALHNIALSIFPLFYIALPLSCVVILVSPMINGGNPHWQLAFGFLVILWGDDTFAYFTGSLIGKHKLFERISPKKTWEGTVGGVIFSLIAAYVLSLFFHQLSTWQWLAGALIITITGTLGDLSESLLKRNLKVKDSGRMFPGHGGVLDRIDSGLFSAPAFLLYLILLNL